MNFKVFSNIIILSEQILSHFINREYFETFDTLLIGAPVHGRQRSGKVKRTFNFFLRVEEGLEKQISQKGLILSH